MDRDFYALNYFVRSILIQIKLYFSLLFFPSAVLHLAFDLVNLGFFRTLLSRGIFFSATTHGNESYYLTMNSILLSCLKDVLYYFSKLNIFKLIYGELKNIWHMVNNTKHVQY